MNSRGEPIKKSFTFVSNNPKILQFLNHVLSPQERARCTPLEGKEVTLSQHYPYNLVTAILKGIKSVAKEFVEAYNSGEVSTQASFHQLLHALNRHGSMGELGEPGKCADVNAARCEEPFGQRG